MKKFSQNLQINRRQLINLGAFGAAIGWVNSFRGLAQTAFNEENRKFILIFLDGGWTSHLSVDPIMGSRRDSGNFEEVYNTHDIRTPTGKDKLFTGIGFQPALDAFASMPTTFINGLRIDVPGHDSASAFMLTGKNLIGRTVTQPALTAMMGASKGGFASHVVLGGGLPLGDTMGAAPPLITNGRSLGEMLAPPGVKFLPETRAVLEEALAKHDNLFFQRLAEKSQLSLGPFRSSQKEISAVFEKFGSKMLLTEDLEARYNVDANWGFGNFAAGFLTLREGLSSIVTIRSGGFDTHTNEQGTQIPRQQQVAGVIKTFVDDLRNTQDPHNPSTSIADNSTILITSEFVRTAKYNGTAGTDHQNSASAILMGKGVKDNQVVGETDEVGLPKGWVEEKPVTYSEETRIDASSLVPTILEQFGLGEEANQMSQRRIHGIFT